MNLDQWFNSCVWRMGRGLISGIVLTKDAPHCASKFTLRALTTSSSTPRLRIYCLPVIKWCRLSFFKKKKNSKGEDISCFIPALTYFFVFGVWWSIFLAKWTFSSKQGSKVGFPRDESFKDCELFYARLFIVTNSWLCSKFVYYVSFMIRFLRLRGQVLLLHSRKTILSSSPPNYLRWIFISLK